MYIANMGLVNRVILGELYTCLSKKRTPQTCNQAPCVAVCIANMGLVTRVIWTSSTYLPGVSNEQPSYLQSKLHFLPTVMNSNKKHRKQLFRYCFAILLGVKHKNSLHKEFKYSTYLQNLAYQNNGKHLEKNEIRSCFSL